MLKPYLSRLRPAEPGRLHPRRRSRFEPAPGFPIDGPAIGPGSPPMPDAPAADVEIELGRDAPFSHPADTAVTQAALGEQVLPPARTAPAPVPPAPIPPPGARPGRPRPAGTPAHPDRSARTGRPAHRTRTRTRARARTRPGRQPDRPAAAAQPPGDHHHQPHRPRPRPAAPSSHGSRGRCWRRARSGAIERRAAPYAVERYPAPCALATARAAGAGPPARRPRRPQVRRRAGIGADGPAAARTAPPAGLGEPSG